MRKIAAIVLVLACAPLLASAHATPVSYEPASSAVLTNPPKEVSIHFSERADAAASSLQVLAPDGEVVSQGSPRVAQGDARVLSVSIVATTSGTYVVNWSVVSADDGHFTKGGYLFAVGQAVDASKQTSSFELVTTNNIPEALGMTVELMGHGLLWAILLFFVFALRPVLGRFIAEKPLLRRLHARVLFGAIALVILGGLLQLYTKSSDLSSLHSVGLLSAFWLYLGTSAGLATLVRMGAATIIAIVFAFARKKIFDSAHFTLWEGIIFGLLCIFAFARAVISHATANPFHPYFSILVNFFHVIEKDVWAGLLFILLLLLLMPRLRGVFSAVVQRVFVMLLWDAAAVAVTASYIVWLHLKSFNNLFSTEWGTAFLYLLCAAVVLVLVRTWSTWALWRGHAKQLPLALGTEFIFAVFVIYFSSIVIITSPPLLTPPTKVFSTTSQGMTINLGRDTSDDSALLLRAGGAPTVRIDSLSVDAHARYPGAYDIPLALLTGTTTHTVSITVPQQRSYDAHAEFEVTKSDFVPPAGWESQRPFDFFTIAIIVLALLALLYSFGLLWILRHTNAPPMLVGATTLQVAGAVVAASVVGIGFFAIVMSLGLANPFKALCESDGNRWHTMPPSIAGVATSMTPREGCMWGMGSYTYLFADQQEYKYYESLPHAEVSLAASPKILVAGVPTTLTVSLTNADGTPATLFVDMEKLVHLVIVSKDETTFAHIHAAQTGDEIAASTYHFTYTFPKAGEYLVSADYAHGLTFESKQFVVMVRGAPTQTVQAKEYPSPGAFGGYQVALKYALPLAGKVATLQYTITKDDKPITTIEPYLSAAAHVSIVKNDFSTFIHTHGELHPPGVPLPPIVVKNGQVVHTMAQMMNVPEHFGPLVETHLIFGTAGLYTVWAEFKVNGTVIPTAFTVRVEE